MARVSLVGPELEENLSLRYLASTLGAAGHSVELHVFNSEADFGPVMQAILAASPDLVGLSLAFQWRAMDSLAIAVALREAGYDGVIAAGGHFATFAAAELLNDFPELDVIVRQEAEQTLVALMNALDAGETVEQIPGLAFRLDLEEEGPEQAAPSPLVPVHFTSTPAVPDLAALPWPDRRGEPARCFDHAIAPLVASRGCYANCTFCCIAAWHEQTLPGRRYRLREVDDVADEMVADHRARGTEIFVFHDDNFFMPGHRKNLERFHALADAVQARGLRRFATVVKARPTDVDPEVFRVLVERLNCIRCYIGVETDSEQGLETLRRWARPRHNREAIEVVRELGLYVCFNMLLFDPDTTLDTLGVNLDFMEGTADYPFNFGRVELYAGTPLLHRMQTEGRVRGDYLRWDYDLHDRDIQRVFSVAVQAFYKRNFGPDALANFIMGTRFDLAVARHFHPEVWDEAWQARGVALTRRLGLDSVAGMREIVAHVRDNPTAGAAADRQLGASLAARLRATEREVLAEARDLAGTLRDAIGQGEPLTEIGDRVATSLQRGIAEEGGMYL